MYKYLLYILLALLANINLSYTQNNSAGIITGAVLSENNTPLEYVSVTLQKSGMTTFTNKAGNFVFNGIINGEYVLTFKLTGYETQSYSFSMTADSEKIKIVMKESLIETPSIDVTGSFNATDLNKSTFSISSLSSRNLSKNPQQNLAQQIENVPGINNISTGSGIGKPVIRGLTSQSVLIIHDGVKQESQQWGDEHGPELSLFDIESIEILRGPASLIYGSDGIGGAINVISKPLQFSNRKKNIFYGEGNFGGASVNKEYFTNIGLGFGTYSFGFKSHFGFRNSGNVKTPEGTLNVETPNGSRTINGGELFNSASKELQGGVNLGWNFKFAKLSFGAELINREVQMHDDPAENPDGTPNQKLGTQQYELEGLINAGKKFRIEPVISFQNQNRKEFETIESKENDIPVLNLKLQTCDAAIRVHQDISSGVNGTYGIAYTFQKNESLAEEKLIPNYSANTYGVFVMEKFNFKLFSFSAGGRYDFKSLNINKTVFEHDSTGNPSKVINSQKKDFSALSGSIGGVFSPLNDFNLFVNFGRGWRAPSEFELYVDGEHEGTGRYEKGLITLNPQSNPKPEISFNIDAGLRYKNKYFSAELSFFRNQIDNFIYPAPTGTRFIETGASGDTIRNLPIYDIRQSQSIFTGYEYNFQFQPAPWIVFTASGDFVKTKNEDNGFAIPFTPPMKNIIELKVQKNNFKFLYNLYFRFAAKFVSEQNDVDPLETGTPSYKLFNAGIGFDFSLGGSIASFDISIENLLDTKYTDHLSRYKYYAMNPGRNINAALTVPFKL